MQVKYKQARKIKVSKQPFVCLHGFWITITKKVHSTNRQLSTSQNHKRIWLISVKFVSERPKAVNTAVDYNSFSRLS